MEIVARSQSWHAGDTENLSFFQDSVVVFFFLFFNGCVHKLFYVLYALLWKSGQSGQFVYQDQNCEK